MKTVIKTMRIIWYLYEILVHIFSLSYNLISEKRETIPRCHKSLWNQGKATLPSLISELFQQPIPTIRARVRINTIFWPYSLWLCVIELSRYVMAQCHDISDIMPLAASYNITPKERSAYWWIGLTLGWKTHSSNAHGKLTHLFIVWCSVPFPS